MCEGLKLLGAELGSLLDTSPLLKIDQKSPAAYYQETEELQKKVQTADPDMVSGK